MKQALHLFFVTHDQEEALTMSDRVAVMNAGKILQIGSPRDIYDHPAERFVADFIGDTNFLDADIESIQQDTITVKLKLGRSIEVKSPDSLKELKIGSSISLAIRPEHAALCTDKTSSQLLGEISNIVYFGTDTRLHVLLENGQDFVVRKQNDPNNNTDYTEGETIGIAFSGDVLQVLRD